MSLFLLSVQIGVQGMLVWCVVLLDPFRSGLWTVRMFFSLAFHKIQLLCIRLQTNLEWLLLWCQQKVATPLAVANGMLLWCMGRLTVQSTSSTFLLQEGTLEPRVLSWQAAPSHWGVPFFAFSVHSVRNCCTALLKCSGKSLLQFAIFFHWPILSILVQTKSGWWLT